jgi:hypothetical protein
MPAGYLPRIRPPPPSPLPPHARRSPALRSGVPSYGFTARMRHDASPITQPQPFLASMYCVRLVCVAPFGFLRRLTS